MTDGKRGKVTAAFEALLNKFGPEIEWVNKEGARAFEQRDYHRVEQATQMARRLQAFQEKLVDLQDEWQALIRSFSETDQATPAHSTARRGRRHQGAGTPASAFRLPILQALVEMGGKGARIRVLERIFDMMKDQLQEHDLASVPSGSPRWQGTAQRARQAMLREDLIRSDSPHGTWEITDAGRRFLVEAKSDE